VTPDSGNVAGVDRPGEYSDVSGADVPRHSVRAKSDAVLLHEIDPCQDPAWPAFVESHPGSSAFHTAGWLEALRLTYGYRPTVMTTSPAGGPLTNGVPFCRIDSWLTGSRMVSLPFSDHCDPLVEPGEELRELLGIIRARFGGGLAYLELRPRSFDLEGEEGWWPGSRFTLHTIDLRAEESELYSRLHKDSIRRKIRRAGREGVVLDEGRSELLLKQFYELQVMTRRRHRVPPQPFAWFSNLVRCLGDKLTIHMARVDAQPVASILTVRHKRTLVYKYGCSDARYHPLGGVPSLFWQAIRQARADGIEEMDLGRTEPANEGLIRFKEHLGGQATILRYRRASVKKPGKQTDGAGFSIPQGLMSILPDRVFRFAGEAFYRHIG
jgi:CelD/BcsL family acetyltransferase involved in cellulose biosynthesis